MPGLDAVFLRAHDHRHGILACLGDPGFSILISLIVGANLFHPRLYIFLEIFDLTAVEEGRDRADSAVIL